MPIRFTDLSGINLKRTLAQRLISVADGLRDLRTKFGMRPFEVHILRTKWTGGRRGYGEESVVSDLPILPVPRIVDLGSLTEIVQPIGMDEIGSVGMEEISARYTDDQLRGYHDDGTPPDDDEQVYYEVTFPTRDEQQTRRRFCLRSAPMYYAGRFEWVVRLEKSHADRDRDGDVR